MIAKLKDKLNRRAVRAALGGSGVLLMVLGAIGWLRQAPAPLPAAQMRALYETPLSAPGEGIAVFHLGHSLVNRDMPAMVSQIAASVGFDHKYESQIGWGTPLQSHWEPEIEIAGFEKENDHPRYRDVFEALDSGAYDAFVLTEMVEIRDAIAYFESADYLSKFAERARRGRPDVRVYLYESWHYVTDPEGWAHRLEADRSRYWEDGVLRPALARAQVPSPIYVIPAGQVFLQIAKRLEQGPIAELRTVEQLFARNPDGTLDPIHVNDLGNYIVAMTHFAALYHKTPVGLDVAALRGDETTWALPSAALAQELQTIVWNVVSQDPLAGLVKGK